MAEAVLEIVLENLKSILQKELGQFLGVDDDMKRLASLFTTIKATLEDAEEKQFSNRVIKDWLAKLKDESLILDDILEEFDLLDKGASILVTTRLSKVATIMGTMSPHELSELSDNDCWELFKHRTFGQNDVEQEELVVIGREIVKKCRGCLLQQKH
ncbi:Putative disease resistance protein RGA1 [Glycine soja]|nr:hypothetical protein JHK87_003653 [Glycine soja]KHN01980.1 Putative disease resistance protein RGA1 [Glycine soja]